MPKAHGWTCENMCDGSINAHNFFQYFVCDENPVAYGVRTVCGWPPHCEPLNSDDSVNQIRWSILNVNPWSRYVAITDWWMNRFGVCISRTIPFTSEVPVCTFSFTLVLVLSFYHSHRIASYLLWWHGSATHTSHSPFNLVDMLRFNCQRFNHL